MPDPLLSARAHLLHDLAARETVDVDVLALLEDVITARRWWIEAWEGGADVVAGQLAQDLQERLLDDSGVRWPACPLHDGSHELRIEPDLGPDPHWVCEEAVQAVAPLGGL